MRVLRSAGRAANPRPNRKYSQLLVHGHRFVIGMTRREDGLFELVPRGSLRAAGAGCFSGADRDASHARAV
jgi:hypothetical protein